MLGGPGAGKTMVGSALTGRLPAVSHEVSMLTRGGFADRMVILDAGRVVASGTTTELTNSTDAFVQTLLGSGF
ncbi:hypothetical protein ACFYO7_30300 [Nocardia salmonicida]|uniref:hypothetical protein n=1 Tax=Nocardia salmonicida TaxID=53431 RepID=UPI00367F8C8B